MGRYGMEIIIGDKRTSRELDGGTGEKGCLNQAALLKHEQPSEIAAVRHRRSAPASTSCNVTKLGLDALG